MEDKFEFKTSSYGLNSLTILELANHVEYRYTPEDIVNQGGAFITGTFTVILLINMCINTIKNQAIFGRLTIKMCRGFLHSKK